MSSRITQYSVLSLLAQSSDIDITQYSIGVLYRNVALSAPIEVTQCTVAILIRPYAVSRVLEVFPPFPLSYPYL